MNNKKNLWIFNHYAITPELPGGTRHFDLGQNLVKQNYNVTIFASSFNYSTHQEMKLSSIEKWKIENVNGLKFLWIKTYPYQRNNWRRVVNMLSYMLLAWYLGRKLPALNPSIKKPDIVIGSSVHLLAVLAAYYVAKYHNAKFIMEVRDLWPQTIIDMMKLSEHNLFINLLRLLEKFLYYKAERIIILLPLAYEYIKSWGISYKKIVWIPNSVNISQFVGAEIEKPITKEFKIMYLGAHGKANALDVLLEAAKFIQEQNHQKIKFIMVGDGTEKPRLIRRAMELGLENIEFRVPVRKSEVPESLSEADALIFNLEKIEVFKYGISSNKLFDYMAAGKPIVFSANVPNNIIEEAQCGFTVPPRNPRKLAESVIRLYETPLIERQIMGERARKYVKKNYDIRIIADRLHSCIEDVLRKG